MMIRTTMAINERRTVYFHMRASRSGVTSDECAVRSDE
jgi:hypothetical protein